ncbi:uncharacterized protein BT62DRAFT_940988 [Guyanagaster necrorhizus]|uniref:MARVEL domain-containing protein n=1 Tax=Guyanagaster necrorhizus TaxID=856835 RepID=A0A9P7W3X2_9AGAR|nr:uncharacterized protein BT62DRAFT_940988 [Guyanagaster necrorhizus MCA 3950]KAG7451975.1 hypothetical protein BT62DRAFT_940988 [Guyanagaster necrorhizus MCA 3950]
MSFDSHVRRGHTITFGLLILFAIITLSISAWLTSEFNKHGHQNGISQRDRVRYVLFASTWTIVFSTFYLVLFLYSATGSVLISIASHLIFLFLTWVIWTAAAAAITQNLGGGLNCKTQDVFVYCSQLNALEAFCWIEWVLVTLAILFVIVRGVQAARRGDGYRGGLVSV